MIERIVSGGQTGVDRAALDAARAAGIDCGGWCPAGRRAEDGIIADLYPLRETRSRNYRARTRLNVRDSDATLVLTDGPPQGGTRTTVDVARDMEKPVLVIDLAPDGADTAGNIARLRAWVAEEGVRVLNVAGPRESQCPGIYCAAIALLGRFLADGAPSASSPLSQ